jgi:hypothetical protein
MAESGVIPGAQGAAVQDAAVVLLAYRRPELTQQALDRLVSAWPGSIVVSVDGRRSSATSEEALWRQQVIDVAELWAANCAKVSVRVWRSNSGLTAHALRIFSSVLSDFHSVIALEEDMQIEYSGLDFLAKTVSVDAPSFATSCSDVQHPAGNESEWVTLFPMQWGTAWNRAFWGQIKQVLDRGSVDRTLIKRRLDQCGYSRIRVSVIADYWGTLFESALSTPDHTDAVFQYASWVAGNFCRLPRENLIRDLGWMDPRGIHPRAGPEAINLSEHDPLFYTTASGQQICLRCERVALKRHKVGLDTPIRRRLRLRQRLGLK